MTRLTDRAFQVARSSVLRSPMQRQWAETLRLTQPVPLSVLPSKAVWSRTRRKSHETSQIISMAQASFLDGVKKA